MLRFLVSAAAVDVNDAGTVPDAEVFMIPAREEIGGRMTDDADGVTVKDFCCLPPPGPRCGYHGVRRENRGQDKISGNRLRCPVDPAGRQESAGSYSVHGTYGGELPRLTSVSDVFSDGASGRREKGF